MIRLVTVFGFFAGVLLRKSIWKLMKKTMEKIAEWGKKEGFFPFCKCSSFFVGFFSCPPSRFFFVLSALGLLQISPPCLAS